MTAACEATGSGQGGGRRRRWWWTRREREAECVPWASHLQMLQRRLLRARGEYAWRRPRARLLACGSGQLGQAVQGGQAQWEGGAEEHRDLRPRHRAHAPRYCPCPRRRTSGGSESSLNLSFGSPRYPLVVTSTRPARVGEALVNLLIGPDARQPPRARPPGREKPPWRSS